MRNPTGTLLIRGARQLVTLRGPRRPRCGAELGELGIINDGALLIRDGRIAEVGTSRRVENLAAARDAEEINAAGRVVMPGFVDSHTHLLFPSTLGCAGEDDEAVKSIHKSSGYRLEGRARRYLSAMARHGTTTVEVKTGCGPDERAELKLLRAAAGLNRGPVEVVPTFLLRLSARHAGRFDWVVRDLLPKIRRRGLAKFADVMWEWDGGPHERFSSFLQMARELGFGGKVHAKCVSPRAAVVAAIQQFAASIDHLEHATVDEARLLAGGGTIATLLPAAAFRNSGPQAPARVLIEAGVPVALATNFDPHHTPTLNMQTILALARLHLWMTPAETITAATLNGAYALGCGASVGSLEPDKQADVLVVDAPDYRDLSFLFGGNVVRVAIKAGSVVYREGDVERVASEGV